MTRVQFDYLITSDHPIFFLLNCSIIIVLLLYIIISFFFIIIQLFCYNTRHWFRRWCQLSSLSVYSFIINFLQIHVDIFKWKIMFAKSFCPLTQCNCFHIIKSEGNQTSWWQCASCPFVHLISTTFPLLLYKFVSTTQLGQLLPFLLLIMCNCFCVYFINFTFIADIIKQHIYHSIDQISKINIDVIAPISTLMSLKSQLE